MVIDPNTITQVAGAAGSLAMGANPYIAAGQLVLGGIQTATALARLNKLRNKQWSQFDENMKPLQQNVTMWQDRMNNGIPQSYQNQAYAASAMQNASAYRNIQDMSGGQMGTAFGRVAAMDRNRLGLNLAQMNDQARREAMGYLANARSQVVSQMNMQTQAERQQRMMQEQALGGALRAGTQNMTQAFDYTVMPKLMGMGGGQQTAQPAAQPAAQQMTTNPVPANLPQESVYNKMQWETPAMGAGMKWTKPNYVQPQAPLNKFSAYSGVYPDATNNGYVNNPYPTGVPLIFQ